MAKEYLAYDNETGGISLCSIYSFIFPCIENNSYFTPAIFINNFPYPKIYERESLIFFINDLIEDDFFSDCENDKNI